VLAATDWDGPASFRPIGEAPPGSWEDAFHSTQLTRCYATAPDLAALPGERGERAIGAVFRPGEPYLRARMAEQFDLVVHIDQTHAVAPLAA
jgi:erythromycin esterase-like protein